MTRRWLDDRGTSLVEAMVAGGILMVIVLGISYQQAQQKGSMKAMDLQLQNLQSINQLLSQISQTPDRFPFFQDNRGTPVIYVACFNGDGGARPAPATAPVPNAPGFQGVFTSSMTDTSAGTRICSDPRVSVIELRVGPDNVNRQLQILALFIPATAVQGGPAPSAKEARSLVSTAVPPVAVAVPPATAPLAGAFSPTAIGGKTCSDQRMSGDAGSPTGRVNWTAWYFCY